MAVPQLPIDPDVGIPDLVRRLRDDSTHLVRSEVRLGKLELTESVQRTGKGVMWLGIAFGMGVLALIALTLLLATLIGRMAGGHMWVGAIVTGLLLSSAAMFLAQRGIAAFAKPSYTFEETRDALHG